jgi:hypothetical protein
MLSFVAISASIAHGQMVIEDHTGAPASGRTWEQFNQTVQRLESEIRTLGEERM